MARITYTVPAGTFLGRRYSLAALALPDASVVTWPDTVAAIVGPAYGVVAEADGPIVRVGQRRPSSGRLCPASSVSAPPELAERVAANLSPGREFLISRNFAAWKHYTSAVAAVARCAELAAWPVDDWIQGFDEAGRSAVVPARVVWRVEIIEMADGRPWRRIDDLVELEAPRRESRP